MTQNPTLSEREALHGKVKALADEAREEIAAHQEWLVENLEQPDPGADDVYVPPGLILALEAYLSAPVAPAEPVAWNEDMAAAPKNGPDFLAKNAKGDIRRCWRAAPSSRTDEIRTFSQQKFAAVAWMPLGAIEQATPAQPSTVTAGGEIQIVPRKPTDREVGEILYNINRKRDRSAHLTEADVADVIGNYFYNVGPSNPPAPSPVTGALVEADLLEQLREAMPDALVGVGWGEMVGTTTADVLCQELSAALAAQKAEG